MMQTHPPVQHLSRQRWIFYRIVSYCLIVSLPVALMVLSFLEPSPAEAPNVLDIPPWLYRIIQFCNYAIIGWVAGSCVTNWIGGAPKKR